MTKRFESKSRRKVVGCVECQERRPYSTQTFRPSSFFFSQSLYVRDGFPTSAEEDAVVEDDAVRKVRLMEREKDKNTDGTEWKKAQARRTFRRNGRSLP